MAANISNLLEACETLAAPARGAYVYFLIQGETIVYVGKSDVVLSRVGNHASSKTFDSVKYLSVAPDDQADLEMALIKLLRPQYNFQKVSALKTRDEEILKKYNLSEELYKIKVLQMQPPAPQEWGSVAYVEGGKIRYGFYDDDECCDHEDCEYGEVEKLIGEIEDDDVAEYLMAKAGCGDKAIVYLFDDPDNYMLVDYSELRVLPDREVLDHVPTLTGAEIEEVRRLFDGPAAAGMGRSDNGFWPRK